MMANQFLLHFMLTQISCELAAQTKELGVKRDAESDAKKLKNLRGLNYLAFIAIDDG